MFGIYKKLAGKIFNKPAKEKTKKRRKPMKLKKLSPEQKARFKSKIKKAGEFVTSGKMQTAASQITRFTQGKPVVIKRSLTKEQREAVPDTVQIFGYPVPKTTAYVGGGLLVLGAGALLFKRDK